MIAWGRETEVLAREKWQIKTIAVLEMVFKERVRQIEKHGHAMEKLDDGVGPDVPWLRPISFDRTAQNIESLFRLDYEMMRGDAEEPSKRLTRMHLVREELAEMFECDPDSPEFIEEAIQVAALCVQWVEYKIEDPRRAV